MRSITFSLTAATMTRFVRKSRVRSSKFRTVQVAGGNDATGTQAWNFELAAGFWNWPLVRI
ncbi:hypothetical protein GGD62_006817 [Bradyrhizobium sp. ERR14]|nr:hypothetical protein [Bradyrhizobium sp. ERR14]